MAYTVELKGDKLILTIDVTKDLVAAAPPSKSGKTKLLATSGGFVGTNLPFGGKVGLSFNATV